MHQLTLKGRPRMRGWSDESGLATITAEFGSTAITFTEADALRLARLIKEAAQRNVRFRERHGIEA